MVIGEFFSLGKEFGIMMVVKYVLWKKLNA